MTVEDREQLRNDGQRDLATEFRELRQQVRRLADIVADLLEANSQSLKRSALDENRKSLSDIRTRLEGK